MKFFKILTGIILSISILSNCSKKDGNSSNEIKIMEPIKVLIYVKNAQNQIFTEGQVRISAKIGEIRYFGSWMEIEDKKLKTLNKQGIAEFNYSTDDINPSVGGIKIIKLEVLNISFNVIFEDDEEIFIESGKTEKINITLP